MENVDLTHNCGKWAIKYPENCIKKKSIKHDCCGSEAKRAEQMKDGSKAEVNKVC